MKKQKKKMPTSPLKTQLVEYHLRLMEQIEQSLSFQGGDFVKWQKKLRRKLRELLGAIPGGGDPPQVREIWKRPHRLGTIQKILVSSEAHYDFPAYVCIPKTAVHPLKFVICLQGHSTGMHPSIGVSAHSETQPIKIEGDRDFAIGCMERGLAALCIEQRAFGETSQHEDRTPSCLLPSMQAIMLGRTLLAERVYDVERGIDYLKSRGDVDMNQIAIMGNSGGGTTSLFAAALIPQIAMAMPSSYFCTFRDSIMSLRHCACNYVPNLCQYAEMADIAGLVAPRPLVLVNGREDPIFPLAGTRRAFRDLKKIYQAAGAGSRCHLVVGKEGHRFYADDAWPVLLKYLK